MPTTITQAQVARLLADQDAAAATFWRYPPPGWQTDFQTLWLNQHIGAPRAVGPDGTVWGAAHGEART